MLRSNDIAFQLFQKIAWKAKDTEDLIAGIDEFLDELTVLPPGKWDPTIRICPPKSLPSPQKRYLTEKRYRWRKTCIAFDKSKEM